MKHLYWLLLVTALVGCNSAPPPAAKVDDHDDHAHSEEAEVTLDAEQQKLGGIETQVVGTRRMQSSLSVPGTVKSTSSGKAVVTPPVAGRLIALTVQIGDAVRQGQVLGTIESTELAQAYASIADAQRNRDAAASMVAQARSEVAIATAKVSSSKANLDRQRQFASAGAFNQAALQAAQGDLNEAESEILSAQQEQAVHADQFRRLENLFKEGIVSKADLESARLELQQDEIRLSRARSRAALAKSAYEREKIIAQRGLANSREIQTAEAEWRASQLERDRSLANLRSAQSALANASKAIGNAQTTYRTFAGGASASAGRVSLVAPIAGRVTHLDVTRGQAVDRTQVLFEIENLSSVWVTANVPERDASKVQKGASVEITLAGLPNARFQGVVQIVGSRVDPKTRSVPVECLVTEANGRLKPDMFATVSLGYGASNDSIAIPRTSIVMDGDKSTVFVKDEHGFARKTITLGNRVGEWVEVRSGLEEGEVVVIKGGFVLASEMAKGELKGHEH